MSAPENPTDPKKSPVFTVVDTTDAIKRLETIERTTVPGAFTRTPKAQVLDATAVEAKFPDHHLRWVNIQDANKAQSRILDGYTRVPQDEGGRFVGDHLVLMKIPRREYEAREEAKRRMDEARLATAKSEFEEHVEKVAKALRDGGISISTNRLGITEERHG